MRSLAGADRFHGIHWQKCEQDQLIVTCYQKGISKGGGGGKTCVWKGINPAVVRNG